VLVSLLLALGLKLEVPHGDVGLGRAGLRKGLKKLLVAAIHDADLGKVLCDGERRE
jgi:hypothetical protein